MVPKGLWYKPYSTVDRSLENRSSRRKWRYWGVSLKEMLGFQDLFVLSASWLTWGKRLCSVICFLHDALVWTMEWVSWMKTSELSQELFILSKSIILGTFPQWQKQNFRKILWWPLLECVWKTSWLDCEDLSRKRLYPKHLSGYSTHWLMTYKGGLIIDVYRMNMNRWTRRW